MLRKRLEKGDLWIERPTNSHPDIEELVISLNGDMVTLDYITCVDYQETQLYKTLPYDEFIKHVVFVDNLTTQLFNAAREVML